MRLRLVLLAAAVAVLMVPVSASAHTTDWYWSAVLAKSRLKTYDVCHESDGGCRDVIDARCTGRGDWIWNDARTLKLYRHFDCVWQYRNGAVWYGYLHVTGKLKYRLTALELVDPA